MSANPSPPCGWLHNSVRLSNVRLKSNKIVNLVLLPWLNLSVKFSKLLRSSRSAKTGLKTMFKSNNIAKVSLDLWLNSSSKRMLLNTNNRSKRELHRWLNNRHRFSMLRSVSSSIQLLGNKSNSVKLGLNKMFKSKNSGLNRMAKSSNSVRPGQLRMSKSSHSVLLRTSKCNNIGLLRTSKSSNSAMFSLLSINMLSRADHRRPSSVLNLLRKLLKHSKCNSLSNSHSANNSTDKKT